MATSGEEIILGGKVYRDVRSIGSGAMARAYAATLDVYPVVIKRLSDRWQTDSPDAEGFRKESTVLRTLNAAEDEEWPLLRSAEERVRRAASTGMRRVIVALLDDGVDENGRPFQVQEMAPPAVEVIPVIDLQSESRVLAVLQRVAQGMALAHQHGFALSDFEPRTKLDRVRVRWPAGGAEPEVRLIDWNITGGSDKFANDLFYFGQHAYHLLAGQLLELENDGKPPHTLGMGAPTWNLLSEASHLLLSRLLQRDEARRYRSAADLAADLAWLMETFELARASSLLDRLRFRILEARGQDRYDRMLAAADLALRYDLSPGLRQNFKQWRDQAREELDKELWQPIAMARISLLAKQFSQADINFSRVLSNLDPRSEPARLARYLRLQARVGQFLRDRTGADPTLLNEWALLNQGVQYLIDRAWDDAAQMLQRVGEYRPDLLNEAAFRDLRALATGGQALNHANDVQVRAQPLEADAQRADWTAIEEKKLAALHEASDVLDTAIKGAPAELVLDDRRQQIERELKNRQRWLRVVNEADAALRDQQYTNAEDRLNQVLHENPQHFRALFLLPKAQSLTRSQQLKADCRKQLALGNYAEALNLGRDALQLFPADTEARGLVSWAEAGQLVQQRFLTDLRSAGDLIVPDLDAASAVVQRLRDWPRSPLQTLLRQIDAAASPASLPAEATLVLSPSQQATWEEVEKAVAAERYQRVNMPLTGTLQKNWDASYSDTANITEARMEIERVRRWANDAQRQALDGWQARFDAYQNQLRRVQQEVVQIGNSPDGSATARLAVCLNLLESLPGDLPRRMTEDVTRLRDLGETCRDQPDQVRGANVVDKPPLLDLQNLFKSAWLNGRVAEAEKAYRASDFERVLEIAAHVERVLSQLPLALITLRDRANDALQKRKAAGMERSRQAGAAGADPGQLIALYRMPHEDDRGAEVQEIRTWVIGQWRKLLRAQTEIDQALDLARQAHMAFRAGALSNHATAADVDFAADERHLEMLQATAGQVDAVAIVSASDLDNLAIRLSTLHGYFEGWGVQPQIKRWQVRIVNFLRQRLTDAAQEAEQALRFKSFESGLQSITSARSLARHEHWQAELNLDLQRLQEIENQIRAGIEKNQRIQEQQREKEQALRSVQQQTTDLMGALERGNPAWGTAAARESIEQLQRSPLIEEAGLTGVLQDCQTIQSRAAALLQQPQAARGFAQTLQARLIVRDRRLSPNPNSRVLMRWNTQQESLQNEMLDLGQRLAATLQSEVDRVVTQSEFDATDLVQLYWEARWCREALEDAEQLDGKDATIKRLTGALRDADRLPASVLTSEAFRNLAREGIDGDEPQRAATGTILDRMQTWLTQSQERPAGVDLPDERGVRYQPQWEIGSDAISEGQRIWQKRQSWAKKRKMSSIIQP
ncbi:MAG: hypothetical protein IPM84_21975 [Anaerolineae bacterium]|nr:hypothetical protein [Anaerolineae bacterium]